jgi:signal transduction histidine kinase
MTKSAENSTRLVLLVAALVAATGLLLVHHDYQSQVWNHQEVMLARGQTVLDALTAGIRAQGRMGRYRPDRLSAIFGELANTPDIVGLDLRTQEGIVISSGGDTDNLPQVGVDKPLWPTSRLVMACEPLLLGHGPGHQGLGHGSGQGGGRGLRGGRGGIEDMDDWKPFPSGPYVLTAVLDTGAMEEEIRGARVRLVISAGVIGSAVLLAALFMLARAKQRNLQMALLVARERTAQQEHLTHLGAGLAHETKNPLGIVRGLAQLIGDSSDSPDVHAANRGYARNIVDEIDRTVGQIDSFLSLARPKTADSRPVDLGPFFGELAPLVGSEARQKGFSLGFQGGGIKIAADEELLRRAVLNLVLNAFRACQPQDEIKIAMERKGNAVSLVVSDTGCGIAPEDIEQVTEPYFTRFEGGSGLGLSLVKQIAQAHGWEINISSDLGRGTRVSLDGIDEVK